MKVASREMLWAGRLVLKLAGKKVSLWVGMLAAMTVEMMAALKDFATAELMVIARAVQ